MTDWREDANDFLITGALTILGAYSFMPVGLKVELIGVLELMIKEKYREELGEI